MKAVVIGAVVALALAPVGAWAQTTGTGVFAQLPPAEQKIARALFEAQSTGASTPLTLDEIAAKKQSRQGWGEIFRQMKTQGVLNLKHLGWGAIRKASTLAIRALLRGQTNYPRMLWKFSSVYNPERQYADHFRPVTYEMRPRRLLALKPTKADLYVHVPAPVHREATSA